MCQTYAINGGIVWGIATVACTRVAVDQVETLVVNSTWERGTVIDI